MTRRLPATPNGTMGTPVWSASMNAPFLNGWSASVGARVPSAKMTTALPSRRSCSPARSSDSTADSRSDRSMEMCPAAFHARPKMGTRSSSFFATKW